MGDSLTHIWLPEAGAKNNAIFGGVDSGRKLRKAVSVKRSFARQCRLKESAPTFYASNFPFV